MTAPSPQALSPWPARVCVYAVLIALALLAIRIIDGHVMARMQRMDPSAPPASMPAR